MNTTDTVQKWQDDEALKRFTLISPLLSEGLDNAGRIAMRKQIAESNGISVRSLYRYEKAYRECQFTGLKPASPFAWQARHTHCPCTRQVRQIKRQGGKVPSDSRCIHKGKPA